MKKILFVFLALVLLAPLMLYGCANNNNNNNVDNDKYVEYQFITYKKEGGTYDYTFQLRVKNYTEEDFDIITRNFTMLYNYNGSSYKYDKFGLYEDEACTSEITMSKVLGAGQTKELYVKTKQSINTSATNVYLKYNEHFLFQIRLSDGSIIRSNTVRA